MATPAETFVSTQAVGNREDLTNQMKMLAPTKTPFTTAIGKSKAKGTFHEWQTEDLPTPRTDNAAREGADAVKRNPINSVRLGNRVQRFEEFYSVSGTQEAVDRAGVSSDLNKQKSKKMLVMKRDREATLLSAIASNDEDLDASGATDAGAPRRLGGAQTFITSNVDRGTGGANGGFSKANMQAPTSGTARVFTEAQVKNVLQKRFKETGDADVSLMALMSPEHKEVFAAFEGLSGTRDQAKNGKRTIVGGADVYVSNFGRIVVTPVAYGLTDAALFLDTEYWEHCVLRGDTSVILAKTGDRTEGMITGESTLVCTNEKSAAVVADLS